jgi:hypothetical protein
MALGSSHQGILEGSSQQKLSTLRPFEIRHSNTKKKARAVKDGVVKDESQNTVKTVRSQKVDPELRGKEMALGSSHQGILEGSSQQKLSTLRPGAWT